MGTFVPTETCQFIKMEIAPKESWMSLNPVSDGVMNELTVTIASAVKGTYTMTAVVTCDANKLYEYTFILDVIKCNDAST